MKVKLNVINICIVYRFSLIFEFLLLSFLSTIRSIISGVIQSKHKIEIMLALFYSMLEQVYQKLEIENCFIFLQRMCKSYQN